MVDLTPEYIDIRDNATPLRDGSIKREKFVSFYLGKYGPFHERFPIDAQLDVEIAARIRELQRQLEQMHR